MAHERSQGRDGREDGDVPRAGRTWPAPGVRAMPGTPGTPGVGRDVVSLARRHRRLFVGAPLVALLLALAYLATATPRYAGTASIEVVERQREDPALRLLTTLGGESDVATEMELLRSRAIAEDVVTALGPRATPGADGDTVPRDAAVDALRAAVTVARPSRDARVVTVTYEGPDATLARDVPNLYVDALVARRRSGRTGEARLQYEALRAQVDTVEAELRVAEGELRRYRQGTNIVDLRTQASAQVERLAELRAQRNAIDAERAALARLLDEVRAETRGSEDAPSPYRRLVAFPSLLRNDAASEMLRSLASVENDLAELRMRRTARDPDRQSLVARVGELESQLEAMTRTYLAGLTGQVRALDARLVEGQRELSRIPGQEVELARRQRSPQVLGELLTVLRGRLKEAELAQSGVGLPIHPLDRAALPTEPAWPRRWIVLLGAPLLGLALAAVLVLLRELTDRRARSAGEIAAALNVPLLGVVPNGGRPRRGLGAIVARVRGTDDTYADPMDDGLPGIDAQSADVREAWQRLCATVTHGPVADGMQRILLVGVTPDADAAVVAARLGALMASGGRRVLLVDADLAGGTLGARLGAGNRPGLAEAAAGRAGPSHVEVPVPAKGAGRLTLLVAGHGDGSAGAPSAPLLDDVGASADVVLIAAPTLARSSDALAFARAADGVVLVAEAERETAEGLAGAVEPLALAGATAIGVVVLGTRRERRAGARSGEDAAHATTLDAAEYERAYS